MKHNSVCMCVYVRSYVCSNSSKTTGDTNIKLGMIVQQLGVGVIKRFVKL